MKRRISGWIFSGLLHAGLGGLILLLSMRQKPSLPKLEETAPCTVPLEVTTVSDVSQAPPSKPASPRPKTAEKKAPEKKVIENVLPEPRPSEDLLRPSEPEPPVETPPPEVLPAPPQKEPEPLPEPVKEKAPEELPQKDPWEENVLPVKKEPAKQAPEKPQKPKVQPPKKAPKKTPKKTLDELMDSAIDQALKKKAKKPSKSSSEDFVSVLKDIDQEEGPSAQTPLTDPNSSSTYGAPRTGELAISIIDRVRRALEGAWQVPLRAHEEGDLVVVVRMSMNPDATVREAEPLHNQSTRSHPAYEVAVESAMRAVNHFRATPLPLPAEYYEQWKTFDFRFIRK